MALPGSHDRFALALLLIFLVLFVALGLAPWYRSDWILENVIVFVGVPVLVLSYRNLPLSKISYICVFVFLCLHEVGAHYTYAEVPYDVFFEGIFGRGLNEILGWQRNHFDRVVHFLWGLLLTYPIREVFIRVSQARGFWGYLLPFLVVVSTSTLFELFEWVAALVFGGDLGVAYLGTQGDVWDAQKDMSLALVGSLIATTVTASINALIDRDFAREWSESLRVKRRQPLGEIEIARLLSERQRKERETGS
jgi:putative membrane protein